MKSCVDPFVLLPAVRRIRHVSQIILRNLCKGPDNIPLDLYYTLSLEGEEPFYVSGVIRNTLNPEWAPIREAFWTQNPRLVLKKCFIFRLFKCKEAAPPIAYLHPDGPSPTQHNDGCLMQKKVSMLNLKLVHTDTIRKLPSLPRNSILYRLTDGFYADQNVQKQLVNMRHRVAPDISEAETQKVNVNSVLTGCEKIFNFQRKIQAVETEVKEIRDQIAAKVKKVSERLCRVRQAQIRTKRLHQLQIMCDKESKSLAEERARVRDIRTKNLIPRIEKLAQHSKVLLDHKNMMTAAAKNLSQRKRYLKDLENEVNERRRDMISALMSIYPIESPERSLKTKVQNVDRLFPKEKKQETKNKDDFKLPGTLNDADVVAAISEANGDKTSSNQSLNAQLTRMTPSATSARRIKESCFTIRKIQLPPYSKLTNEDEEDVSTALGFVAHLVCLLSKYLEIPLRYRIVYAASRSGLCDDVLRSTLFPLYLGNPDEKARKARRCGCILLNKNIEHLLNVRFPGWHFRARNAENTLENLDILLRHEVPS